MSRFECFRDGKRDLESVLQRERTASESLGQSLALDHFHDDHGAAFEIKDVVKGRDSRMIERSEKLRLVLQAGAPLGTSREFIGKDFERDLSPETGVASAEDLPHASGPERTDDLVRTQALPGAEAHGMED